MKCNHAWQLIAADAKAFYRKSNWAKSKAVIVEGTVYRCAKCDKMIMEPNDLRLQPVYVEFCLKENNDRA